MTRIDQIHQNVIAQTGQRTTASTIAHFQTSLESALEQSAPAKTDKKQTTALSEPQSLNLGQPGPSETDVVRQTDSLLGLLESYANGLDNPGATLKDLASLVTRIKDGAQQLMASVDKHAEAGSDLKDIAAQTALTANVEYIKFQRGDFI